MRSVSARPFAEPWPERPAAKRQKREKWRLRKRGAMRSVPARPFAEPWPERAVAKRPPQKGRDPCCVAMARRSLPASHQTPETTYGPAGGGSSSGGSSGGAVVVVVPGTVVVVVVVVFLDR